MITIFEQNTTSFNNLGLGSLMPSSCVIKEELNGAYELELTHPYDTFNKWQRLENNRIIVANTPNGRQPFRIYRVVPNLDSVKVYAHHIFYDLLDNFVTNLNVSNVNAATALNSLKNALAYTMPFTFSTSLNTTGKLVVDYENAVFALLSGEEEKDSFIKNFGGEIIRDNYNISFVSAVGTDNGVQIRYSKNLVGLEIDEDLSEVATRIYPIGKEGLKGTYVDSPYINNYPYPKIRTVENSELTTNAQLTEYVRQLYASGADLPNINIKVNFALLAETEEYKDYAVLEQINLGDLVTVINSKMGFNKKAKVISYEWDCLTKKYNKMQLGDFLANIATSLTSSIQTSSLALNTAQSNDVGVVATALQTHIDDKSNPHDVTIEQIGAMPSDRIIVNPNLLDNAYFGNPVNQRGQTKYTSGNALGFNVDRWMNGWTADIDVTENGLLFNKTTQFFQRLEPALISAINGKTVTMSALVDNELFTQTAIVGTMSGSGNIPAVFNTSVYGGDVFIMNVESNKTVKAAKLELGSVQTLAHLENGVWVLNEIPDYAEQLAICQRYEIELLDRSNAGQNYVMIGMAADSTTVYGLVSLPVTMRTIPSLITDCSSDNPYYSAGAYSNGYTFSANILSLSVYGKSEHGLIIGAKGTDFIAGNMYIIFVQNASEHQCLLFADL